MAVVFLMLTFGVFPVSLCHSSVGVCSALSAVVRGSSEPGSGFLTRVLPFQEDFNPRAIVIALIIAGGFVSLSLLRAGTFILIPRLVGCATLPHNPRVINRATRPNHIAIGADGFQGGWAPSDSFRGTSHRGVETELALARVRERRLYVIVDADLVIITVRRRGGPNQSAVVTKKRWGSRYKRVF
ncbi:hypothetical protein EDD22DRAFT_849410 [Suillus occidentalis]|nr:hypothetical protein EDD22DRAFT_849410 [Suillus occidentalis]